MPLKFEKARKFVYAYGTLWERVLFSHLFEGASLAHVHQCLTCYKNPDGGWGHGLQFDIKTPDSHPLALEFALHIVRVTGIRANSLFHDAPEWLARTQAADGSLTNPASVLDYPCALQWIESGGQISPASIVGNLMRLSIVVDEIEDATRRWVLENLTLEQIRANTSLMTATHAHDYFLNAVDFPNIAVYRAATLDNILMLCDQAEPEQYYQFALLASDPESPVARAASTKLKRRIFSALAKMQHADGAWHDEHGLTEWHPWTTIAVLHALRQHGYWQPDEFSESFRNGGHASSRRSIARTGEPQAKSSLRGSAVRS
jgi:hypothetical protein